MVKETLGLIGLSLVALSLFSIDLWVRPPVAAFHLSRTLGGTITCKIHIPPRWHELSEEEISEVALTCTHTGDLPIGHGIYLDSEVLPEKATVGDIQTCSWSRTGWLERITTSFMVVYHDCSTSRPM